MPQEISLCLEDHVTVNALKHLLLGMSKSVSLPVLNAAELLLTNITCDRPPVDLGAFMAA